MNTSPSPPAAGAWTVRPDQHAAVAALAAEVVEGCADPALKLVEVLRRASWVMDAVEHLDGDVRGRPEWQAARRCWHRVNAERLRPCSAAARPAAVDGLCAALAALVNTGA